MTVSKDYNKHVYEGNGLTVDWPYDFDLPITAAGTPDTSLIHVFRTNLRGEVTEVTAFSVDAETGTLTYPTSGSPLETGEKLTILRLLDVRQQFFDPSNQANLYPETLEDNTDRLVMMLQQLQEETVRAVKVSVSTDLETEDITAEGIFEARDIAISAAETAEGWANTFPAIADELDVNIVLDEADLRAKLAVIGASNATLVIAKPIPIAEDLAIPSNVALSIKRTGQLQPAIGTTLTINGPIEAGLWQIFDGDGTVNGSPKIKTAYPEWFGAVGDFSWDTSTGTENSVAFEKVVNFFHHVTLSSTKEKPYLLMEPVGLPTIRFYRSDGAKGVITGGHVVINSIKPIFTSYRGKYEEGLHDGYTSHWFFLGISFSSVTPRTNSIVFDGDRLYNTTVSDCCFADIEVIAYSGVAKSGGYNGGYFQSFIFDRNKLQSCGTIIKGTLAYNLRVTNNQSEASTNGIIFENTDAYTADPNVFSGCIENNLFENSGTFVSIPSSINLSIRNNYNEGAQAGITHFISLVRDAGRGGGHTRQCNISNNVFVAPSAATHPTFFCVEIETAVPEGVVIVNNHCTRAGSLLKTGAYGTVTYGTNHNMSSPEARFNNAVARSLGRSYGVKTIAELSITGGNFPVATITIPKDFATNHNFFAHENISINGDLTFLAGGTVVGGCSFTLSAFLIELGIGGLGNLPLEDRLSLVCKTQTFDQLPSGIVINSYNTASVKLFDVDVPSVVVNKTVTDDHIIFKLYLSDYSTKGTVNYGPVSSVNGASSVCYDSCRATTGQIFLRRDCDITIF